MGKKIKILSLNFPVPAAAEPTGRFTIAEDVTGAVETELSATALMTVDGILYVPLTTGALTGGKYYKIKCVLTCGSTFAKVVYVPESCSPIADLSIELLYLKNAFTGLKGTFTLIPGITSYVLAVYKVAAPGDPGSIFVGSFPFTSDTGQFVISNPALYEDNVHYFGILGYNCIGTNTESDPVEWTPHLIGNEVSGLYAPGDGPGVLTITVDTTAAVPADIDYEVTYKIGENVYGPVVITVDNGLSSGATDIDMSAEDAGDLDPDGYEVIFVNPKLINTTLILN